MIELPPDHELIALFGSEPRVTDPEYPWQYNTVIFNLERGEDRLRVVIDAGLERVRLTWERAKVELLDIVLEGAMHIATEQAEGRETFIVEFLEAMPLDRLRIRTKPTIHFFWRTRGAIPL